MRFWVNVQIAANSCTPECTILIQQACSFAELQRTCKSRIPHFHSKEAKLLMHNYSSTKWSYTCYPTFSKTNRNEHTKKESIKKKRKSSSCIVFPDNFNLTRYSCQCPNTQSQCSKNKSHFSQKTPAPHPDHVKMKTSDEINDLHSANHKKQRW